MERKKKKKFYVLMAFTRAINSANFLYVSVSFQAEEILLGGIN